MSAAAWKGQVDFGIITIREDEFGAVLDRFPRSDEAVGRRRYNMSRVLTRKGDSYVAAVIRCFEQGTTEALDAARDLLEDLDPQWLLVVGIAGGVPASEFTLGDVVVSTRVLDFSVEAVLTDGSREYTLTGGPMHRDAASVAANLRAMKHDLGPWSSPDSIGAPRPPVDLSESGFYGDDEWRRKARESLRRHFEGKPERGPIVTAGPIASSDRLIKDTEIARVWLKVARQILAVEMESAGVYRASSGRSIPTLAIRGISDIIGFKRDPDWTGYACHSAAAFAQALLHARPIEPRGKAAGAKAPLPAGKPRDAGIAQTRSSSPQPGLSAPPKSPDHRRRAGRDKVLLSFIEQDKDTLDALKERLQLAEKQGLLTTWDATQIRPGEVIAHKKAEALASARLAVLLVSSRFLVSEACEREVSALLSAGVPLLCLYIDHSMVELASYAYEDPETRARMEIRLTDLGALNDHERPLRSLSPPERSAALNRAALEITKAARSAE